MPAVSKAQQKFMGMVHATQKGDIEAPSPEVAKAAGSMTKKSAKDFASTKHKSLPNKVGENITTKNHKPETKGERDFWNFHKSSTYTPDRGYGPELDTVDFDDTDKEVGYQSNDKDNEKRGYEPVMKNYDTQTHKLKEGIRKIVREIMIQSTLEEMNVTGNVQGYQTPYAFTKPGDEKKKGKKQADLTGYSVVNEASKKINVNKLKKGDKLKIKIGNDIENVEVLTNFKAGLSKFDFITLKRKVGAPYTITVSKLEKILAENRWLELKKEETPANQKIGKGISNINKQLAEMEKFLNWYGRLKQENGISNENFWKRTNGNIIKIKERLIRLEAQIRKISE